MAIGDEQWERHAKEWAHKNAWRWDGSLRAKEVPQMRCDFCPSTEPTVCYLTHAASLRVEMTDGQSITYNSDPHWRACAPCSLLIETQKHEDLARRQDTLLPYEFTFTIHQVLFWNGNPRMHGAAHE